MEIIIVIVSWVLFGGVTSFFASQRGRDPFGWFLIGLLLGVLGLLVLFLLPPLKAEEEEPEAEAQKKIPENESETSPYLAHDWFYLDSQKKQVGPCSFLTLRRDWHLQKLTQDNYVWTEGMEGWTKVEALPEVKQALEI